MSENENKVLSCQTSRCVRKIEHHAMMFAQMR